VQRSTMEDIKPVKTEEPPSSFEVKPKLEDLADLFTAASPKRSPSSYRPPSPPSPRSPSPEPKSKPRGRRKGGKDQSPPPPPTLIDDLPTAWDEAHRTFESMERCVYERKDMGLSREMDEMMVCDCVYDRREWSLPLLCPANRRAVDTRWMGRR
jgi:hypothetical protein